MAMSIQLPNTSPATLHATAVAYGRHGLLFVGPSGSGKSTLALQLMGLGAILVSDDIVALRPGDGPPILTSPDTAADTDRIEARGVGLLRVNSTTFAPLHVIVDMGAVEGARLPDRNAHMIDNVQVPVLKKVDTPAFPAILMTYVAQDLFEV